MKTVKLDFRYSKNMISLQQAYLMAAFDEVYFDGKEGDVVAIVLLNKVFVVTVGVGEIELRQTDVPNMMLTFDEYYQLAQDLVYKVK